MPKTNSEIIGRTLLHDGRVLWIQRVKIPGVRKPHWSVVTSVPLIFHAPTIVDCDNKAAAEKVHAEILREDAIGD